MATPSEELAAIRESLGDLPERLAEVLQSGRTPAKMSCDDKGRFVSAKPSYSPSSTGITKAPAQASAPSKAYDWSSLALPSKELRELNDKVKELPERLGKVMKLRQEGVQSNRSLPAPLRPYIEAKDFTKKSLRLEPTVIPGKMQRTPYPIQTPVLDYLLSKIHGRDPDRVKWPKSRGRPIGKDKFDEWDEEDGGQEWQGMAEAKQWSWETAKWTPPVRAPEFNNGGKPVAGSGAVANGPLGEGETETLLAAILEELREQTNKERVATEPRGSAPASDTKRNEWSPKPLTGFRPVFSARGAGGR